MPSTLEVGQRLAELCREVKNLEAVDELYASNIVSIETRGDEHMPKRMEGIDAIRGKTRWWLDNHEIHDCEVRGPWPKDDQFIVTMKIDVTSKIGPFAGQRMQFEEACLYTVRDGKIVQEEFFYHLPE
jgi:ketosteroid isomerase-like protein